MRHRAGGEAGGGQSRARLRAAQPASMPCNAMAAARARRALAHPIHPARPPRLSATRCLSTAPSRASSSRAAGVEQTSWRPRSSRSRSVLLVARCRGGRHAASCGGGSEGGRVERRPATSAAGQAGQACQLNSTHQKSSSGVPACAQRRGRGGTAGKCRTRPCTGKQTGGANRGRTARLHKAAAGAAQLLLLPRSPARRGRAAHGSGSASSALLAASTKELAPWATARRTPSSTTYLQGSDRVLERGQSAGAQCRAHDGGQGCGHRWAAGRVRAHVAAPLTCAGCATGAHWPSTGKIPWRAAASREEKRAEGQGRMAVLQGQGWSLSRGAAGAPRVVRVACGTA